VDSNIAFSNGLHVGEFAEMTAQLGDEWMSRLVAVPMIGVEFVGTMAKDQLS
jgi:hypothetical protein